MLVELNISANYKLDEQQRTGIIILRHYICQSSKSALNMEANKLTSQGGPIIIFHFQKSHYFFHNNLEFKFL